MHMFWIPSQAGIKFRVSVHSIQILTSCTHVLYSFVPIQVPLISWTQNPSKIYEVSMLHYLVDLPVLNNLRFSDHSPNSKIIHSPIFDVSHIYTWCAAILIASIPTIRVKTNWFIYIHHLYTLYIYLLLKW